MVLDAERTGGEGVEGKGGFGSESGIPRRHFGPRPTTRPKMAFERTTGRSVKL